MVRVSCATVVLLCGSARPSNAQFVLTFEEAVAKARDQAGTVAVARSRIAEAEASVLAASARLRDNPVLDVAAGPRRSSGGGDGATDIDVGLSQQFETGGQRRARMDTALASVDRLRAVVEQASRGAVLDAATAFMRGIAAGERLRIAEEADMVSRGLLATMERRYAAGDIAAIELNLTRIEAARSAATLASARVDLVEASGTLRAILRLPQTEPLELHGSLDVPPMPPLGSLETGMMQRPELKALEADAREADAQVRLGRALRRPDVSVRLNYAREQADTIVLGGMTVTIPAFQKGQGTLAAGLAMAGRARAELEIARQSLVAQLRTAYDVHAQRARLAETLTRDVLASVLDNESLARRSYDAGELNLMDFLLIRREALDTRATIIDRRLEAALSRLQVDALSGGLR